MSLLSISSAGLSLELCGVSRNGGEGNNSCPLYSVTLALGTGLFLRLFQDLFLLLLFSSALKTFSSFTLTHKSCSLRRASTAETEDSKLFRFDSTLSIRVQSASTKVSNPGLTVSDVSQRIPQRRIDNFWKGKEGIGYGIGISRHPTLNNLDFSRMEDTVGENSDIRLTSLVPFPIDPTLWVPCPKRSFICCALLPQKSTVKRRFFVPFQEKLERSSRRENNPGTGNTFWSSHRSQGDAGHLEQKNQSLNRKNREEKGGPLERRLRRLQLSIVLPRLPFSLLSSSNID